MGTMQSGCVPGMVCDSEWNLYAREEDFGVAYHCNQASPSLSQVKYGSVAPYDGDDLEDLRQRK
jgi:hypothetical protein